MSYYPPKKHLFLYRVKTNCPPYIFNMNGDWPLQGQLMWIPLKTQHLWWLCTDYTHGYISPTQAWPLRFLDFHSQAVSALHVGVLTSALSAYLVSRRAGLQAPLWNLTGQMKVWQFVVSDLPVILCGHCFPWNLIWLQDETGVFSRSYTLQGQSLAGVYWQ